MSLLDDMLRAKEPIEAIAPPPIYGVKINPADLSALRHNAGEPSPAALCWAAFCGIPVITDVKVARGTVRIARTREQWREMREETE